MCYCSVKAKVGMLVLLSGYPGVHRLKAIHAEKGKVTVIPDGYELGTVKPIGDLRYDAGRAGIKGLHV
jgi:hypothetical protein